MNYKVGTLESVIRNIVLDVLAEKFIGQKASGETNINVGGNLKPTRRRRRSGKGRVTDPSKDKRLKANRK